MEVRPLIGDVISGRVASSNSSMSARPGLELGIEGSILVPRRTASRTNEILHFIQGSIITLLK